MPKLAQKGYLLAIDTDIFKTEKQFLVFFYKPYEYVTKTRSKTFGKYRSVVKANGVNHNYLFQRVI